MLIVIMDCPMSLSNFLSQKEGIRECLRDLITNGFENWFGQFGVSAFSSCLADKKIPLMKQIVTLF